MQGVESDVVGLDVSDVAAPWTRSRVRGGRRDRRIGTDGLPRLGSRGGARSRSRQRALPRCRAACSLRQTAGLVSSPTIIAVGRWQADSRPMCGW